MNTNYPLCRTECAFQVGVWVVSQTATNCRDQIKVIIFHKPLTYADLFRSYFESSRELTNRCQIFANYLFRYAYYQAISVPYPAVIML
jgi:hypothetical protein